jgi:cyclic pyranopterin monophosphate synthase
VSDFTHLDAEGRPRMVAGGAKPATAREAVAEGHVRTLPETVAAIDAGRTAKGGVLAVAELAGIMAAKRTADLIPLCHPLPLTAVEVEVRTDPGLPGVRVRATARTVGATGVEMEALTAASCALLTVYDMCKARDRGMCIGGIRLLSKTGGRSGTWTADGEG